MSRVGQEVRLYKWDDVPLETISEVFARKIVWGEREMVAQIFMKKGCVVPMHNHEAEQMTQVFTGALRFVIAGEEIIVRPGEILRIPSWVEHSATALEDTMEVDIFSPIRRDWLDKTDNYLRR